MPQITIKCEWCGKPFKIWPSRKGVRKHCSKNCLRRALSKKRSGKRVIWKGGRYKSSSGYCWLTISGLNRDDKELAKAMSPDGERVSEHRLIMARKLGRPLKSYEIVHHKNRKRDDNQIENLELTTRGKHNAFSHIGMCPRCGYKAELKEFL